MEKVSDFIQNAFYDQGQPSSEEEVDPFDEKDDAPFEDPAPSRTGTDRLQDSPVTSPESNIFRRISKSFSSTRSSTVSVGGLSLKSSSRRLSPTEGLGLLKRCIEVLRKSKDVRIVEHSIRKVRELMACDFINESHVLGSGVVQTVCTLLGSHVVVASLAEETCRFLAIICDCSREAREIADEFYAVDSLRAVMEVHFELYSNTVDAAMRALAVLCKYSVTDRASLLHSRTLEWILVCQRQWRSARSLQISAFLCLERALSQHEESQQRTVSLGIFQEILYALHCFDEDSDVQHHAMALLNTLISSSDDYRIMSAAEGIIEPIIQALQIFPRNDNVVSCAARAVEYYCMTADTRQQFAELNGFEAMVGAFKELIKTEQGNESCVHRTSICNCIRALGQLSRRPEWRAMLYEPDHVSCIIFATSQYRDDRASAECTSTLLCDMSLDESEKKSGAIFFRTKNKAPKSVVAQLVPTINSLLSANTSSTEVAEKCCTALLNFCVQGRTNIVKRSCPGLLQTIQQVVEKLSDCEVVVNQAISLVMQIR